MMVFGVWWPVLPIVGLGSPANYILPVAAQSFGQIASIARLTKSTYSEAIQMDYVTMARAKGLSNLYITARHVRTGHRISDHRKLCCRIYFFHSRNRT